MISHRYGRALWLLLSLPLFLACSDRASDNNKKAATEHLVEITRAELREVSLQQTLPGTLQPIRSVNIFSQEEGLLISLPYYEGDRVSQGTEIARLDDALIRAELSKASANLKQAQLNLKRLKDLLPRKLASDDEVAKARTAVQVAQAELDHIAIRLEYTKITAPFDGTISARLVEPGDVIARLSHLLTLIDTSSLKATVYISELLLPLVKQDDAVSISIDALGDQQFAARVMRIHPVIDRDTRRGVIEVELTPVPKQALPGQLCRITINTHGKQRLMIPFDAMRNDSEGAFVFRIVDGKALKTPIRTGLKSGYDIEVLEGLQADQPIVLKGFFGLKHEQPVSIVGQDAPVTAAAQPTP